MCCCEDPRTHPYVEKGSLHYSTGREQVVGLLSVMTVEGLLEAASARWNNRSAEPARTPARDPAPTFTMLQSGHRKLCLRRLRRFGHRAAWWPGNSPTHLARTSAGKLVERPDASGG